METNQHGIDRLAVGECLNPIETAGRISDVYPYLRVGFAVHDYLDGKGGQLEIGHLVKPLCGYLHIGKVRGGNRYSTGWSGGETKSGQSDR